jgi:hypothetical protein
VLADSVGWYQPGDATREDPAGAAPDDVHADDAEAARGDSGEAAQAGRDETLHEDGDHEVAAEVNHSLSTWFQPEHAATSDTELAAPVGDEPADVTEHDTSAEAEPTHDFWAEFASSDPDAHAGTPETEPGGPATDADAETEPTEEPALVDHSDLFTRKASERTSAPWSWPLAEAEVAPAHEPHPGTAPVEETPEPATTSAQGPSESDDWEPVFEAAGDQSFFQRDEPVGSQFVDFDEVRTELVQIGIVWLGEANAVPVTALLRKTRSTIDDFVATIDTIRGLHLEGQDPASVQAMAREMHQQAAERLCGA